MIKGNCEVASQTKREIYTTERRPRHVCFIVSLAREWRSIVVLCGGNPIPASLTVHGRASPYQDKRTSQLVKRKQQPGILSCEY